MQAFEQVPLASVRHSDKTLGTEEYFNEVARAMFGLEDRVRFLEANAGAMADAVLVEAYDLVYAFGVIHHTPHPHRVLEQIRRYLHPDGAVKIRVYHRRSWKVLQILCRRGFRFWALDQLSARYSEAQTGCPVTYTYTARQARRLLEDRGFRVSEVRVEHLFPYRIADYVAYRYRRVWYFRWLPAPVFRRLEGWLSWQPCLTAGLGS